MPCGDSALYEKDSRQKKDKRLRTVRRRLDLVTRLLCSTCKRLEELKEDDVFDDLETIENGELKKWWTEHQKLDAKRKKSNKH